MKKKKIQELMAIQDMTEEIEGGDFFDDDNLVHEEEEYVEGVQILSKMGPNNPQNNQNSGNVLQGSSEMMNYDYTQQNPVGFDQSNSQYPPSNYDQSYNNSRPQSNRQYNQMPNNQPPPNYY